MQRVAIKVMSTTSRMTEEQWKEFYAKVEISRYETAKGMTEVERKRVREWESWREK